MNSSNSNPVDVTQIAELMQKADEYHQQSVELSQKCTELITAARNKCTHPAYQTTIQSYNDEYGKLVESTRWYTCYVCKHVWDGGKVV